MQSIADFKPIKKLALPIEQKTFENEWFDIKTEGDTTGIIVSRFAEIEGCKPIKIARSKPVPAKKDTRMQLMMERIFENMDKNQKQKAT